MKEPKWGELKEPENLVVSGRDIDHEEMANLRPYFDNMNHLIETVKIVEGNIKDANDIDAASTWVQWLLNVALDSFDVIMEQ
tara:strand:+ start:156 stop:401 length:246 start_codon:yes stop_codon:yes gene_type:complete